MVKKFLLVGGISVIFILAMVIVAINSIPTDVSSVNSEGEFIPSENYITIEGEGTEYKLLTPDENVEKPSIWQRISSLFGGNQFNFVSELSEDVEQGTQGCFKTTDFGTYTHFKGVDVSPGRNCNVGEFIVYTSQGGDIPAGNVLFDNVWKKTTSDDLPNFQNYHVDDKYFTYSYGCYDCQIQSPDDFEKSCVIEDLGICVSASDPSCKSGMDLGFEKSCLAYLEELSKVTCYTCSGENINSKVFQGSCGTGYVEDILSLNCQVEEQNSLSCYQCDGTTRISQTFVGSCGTGWSPTPSSCTTAPILVPCYTCISGQTFIQEFENSCPSTWFTSEADCEVVSPPENTIACYQCDGSVQNQNLFDGNSCPSGWYGAPQVCSASGFVIGELFDFENKPIRSVLIIIGIAGIIMTIFAISLKPKNGGIQQL